MGAISVISWERPEGHRADSLRRGEVVRYNVCGRDVIRMKLMRGGRRYIKRFFSKNSIESIVVEGEIPAYVSELAEAAGITVYSGKKIIRSLLPYLISRAAKENPDAQCCTVYSSRADDECIEIIKLAAEKFRYVSLCCQEEADDLIGNYIMEETGLALKIGEIKDGVAIVCWGKGGEQQVKINLVDGACTMFVDKNHKILSAALAEAIAGENADKQVLDRLGLKIHKKLDKIQTVY